MQHRPWGSLWRCKRSSPPSASFLWCSSPGLWWNRRRRTPSPAGEDRGQRTVRRLDQTALHIVCWSCYTPSVNYLQSPHETISGKTCVSSVSTSAGHLFSSSMGTELNTNCAQFLCVQNALRVSGDRKWWQEENHFQHVYPVQWLETGNSGADGTSVLHVDNKNVNKLQQLMLPRTKRCAASLKSDHHHCFTSALVAAGPTVKLQQRFKKLGRIFLKHSVDQESSSSTNWRIGGSIPGISSLSEAS